MKKYLTPLKKQFYTAVQNYGGIKQLAGEIIRFCFAGFINTFASYAVTVLCLRLGLRLLLANAMAFIISTACAFFLNHFFVFRTKINIFRGLIKSYCTYAFTGLGLNSVLLYIFADRLGISEYLAPLLTLFVTVPCNFLLNKLWAMKKSGKSGTHENR